MTVPTPVLEQQASDSQPVVQLYVFCVNYAEIWDCLNFLK